MVSIGLGSSTADARIPGEPSGCDRASTPTAWSQRWIQPGSRWRFQLQPSSYRAPFIFSLTLILLVRRLDKQRVDDDSAHHHKKNSDCQTHHETMKPERFDKRCTAQNDECDPDSIEDQPVHRLYWFLYSDSEDKHERAGENHSDSENCDIDLESGQFTPFRRCEGASQSKHLMELPWQKIIKFYNKTLKFTSYPIMSLTQ